MFWKWLKRRPPRKSPKETDLSWFEMTRDRLELLSLWLRICKAFVRNRDIHLGTLLSLPSSLRLYTTLSSLFSIIPTHKNGVSSWNIFFCNLGFSFTLFSFLKTFLLPHLLQARKIVWKQVKCRNPNKAKEEQVSLPCFGYECSH